MKQSIRIVKYAGLMLLLLCTACSARPLVFEVENFPFEMTTQPGQVFVYGTDESQSTTGPFTFTLNYTDGITYIDSDQVRPTQQVVPNPPTADQLLGHYADVLYIQNRADGSTDLAVITPLFYEWHDKKVTLEWSVLDQYAAAVATAPVEDEEMDAAFAVAESFISQILLEDELVESAHVVSFSQILIWYKGEAWETSVILFPGDSPAQEPVFPASMSHDDALIFARTLWQVINSGVDYLNVVGWSIHSDDTP